MYVKKSKNNKSINNQFHFFSVNFVDFFSKFILIKNELINTINKLKIIRCIK